MHDAPTTRTAGRLPNEAEATPMRWTLSIEHLDVIWGHVYPRIVGLKWKEPRYAEFFLHDSAFRVDEIRRIGCLVYPAFSFPEGMGVWVQDAGERRTDFVLTPHGLVLPWPQEPTASKVYQAYSLLGGALPRAGRRLTDAEHAYVQELQNWDQSRSSNGQTVQASTEEVLEHAFKKDSYFMGNDLRALLNQVPKIIAQAWGNNIYKQEFLANPLSKISDVSLPGTLALRVVDGAETGCIEVTDAADGAWTMWLPMPAEPDLDAMLSEFIAGTADNPLYTGCPSGDCGPGRFSSFSFIQFLFWFMNPFGPPPSIGDVEGI